MARRGAGCARGIAVVLGLAGVLMAGWAQAVECGWQPVADEYCAQDARLVEQHGYTSGTPFTQVSRITENDTKNDASSLPSNSADVYIDRHSICRYLSNQAAEEYFVPFRTSAEWKGYLNNLPTGQGAVPCAREAAAELKTVCGDVDYEWKRGKEADLQVASFDFKRARDWKHSTKTVKDCNCRPASTGGSKTSGLAVMVCDKCDVCVDSGRRATTECRASLTRKATAVGAAGKDGTAAARTASWVDGDQTGGGQASSIAVVEDCDPPPPVEDGVCGSAHGVAVESKPTAGLCAAGTATAVTGSGPWRWSCKGSADGTDAACMAPKLAAAQCGASNGVVLSSAPKTDLCKTGTHSLVSGSGPWTWTCTQGSSKDECTAEKKPACGDSDGQSFTAKPTADLCAYGTASGVTGTGPWKWTCKVLAEKVSCTAEKKVAGCSPFAANYVGYAPRGTVLVNGKYPVGTIAQVPGHYDEGTGITGNGFGLYCEKSGQANVRWQNLWTCTNRGWVFDENFCFPGLGGH